MSALELPGLEKEKRTAIFSPCRVYRYWLQIEWDSSLPRCQFIGLNPSTADEIKDDNTVRRCKNFCKSWGFGTLIMTNLFAFRSTDPEPMKRHAEPIGELGGQTNDYHLASAVHYTTLTIAAWGNHGLHMGRGAHVARLLSPIRQLQCLRITKAKQPEHPLYLKATTKPIEYSVLADK